MGRPKRISNPSSKCSLDQRPITTRIAATYKWLNYQQFCLLGNFHERKIVIIRSKCTCKSLNKSSRKRYKPN